MSQIEHSIGFYLLESYRIQNGISRMHSRLEDKSLSTLERFCTRYTIVQSEIEIAHIQEQISLSNAKKEIDTAEQKAFFAYNIRRKVSHLLDKICKQK